MDNELDQYLVMTWYNAKFHVSIFDSIDDAKNRILCTNNTILFIDKNASDKECIYVIRKKSKEHIYYKDLIDVLVKTKFVPFKKHLTDIIEVKIVETLHSDNNDCIRIYRGLWN